MADKQIGKVTHYFNKIGVCVIELSDSLSKGDRIRIKGANTDFSQTVDSMQIDKAEIEQAESGAEIGMKTAEQVRPGDIVFKVE